MVIIDRDLCTDCGACSDVCPALVIESREGAAEPLHSGACIKCWHCVAVCPTGAVNCDEFSLGEFKPLSEFKNVPTPAAVRNAIVSRRSVREFKEKEVPRELIEELVAAAAHSPTGHNAQTVRLNVITDQALLRRVDARIMKLFEGLAVAMANPVGTSVMRAFAGRDIADSLADQKEALARFKAAGGEKSQHVFRGAPVLIIAHHGADALSGKDDCIIALSQIAMLAEAHGLGTTWIGYLVGAALIDPTLKKPFRVPLMNHLAGALIIGWPRRKYKRMIPRKPLDVKWM